MISPRVVQLFSANWTRSVGVIDISTIVQCVAVEADQENGIPAHVNVVCEHKHCTTLANLDVLFEEVLVWCGVEKGVSSPGTLTGISAARDSSLASVSLTLPASTLKS